MLSLRKPSPDLLRLRIGEQQDSRFTYKNTGATHDRPPPGFSVHHVRRQLGSGEAAFLAAKAALSRWEQFRTGWTDLCWPDAPLEPGATVGVLTRVLGLWTLNVCRIVYVLDEKGPVHRFGFAYGTLAEHAESGEERFLVEWDAATDAVHYDVLAFFRPRAVLARLAWPYLRRLVNQFREDSAVAMCRAVQP